MIDPRPVIGTVPGMDKADGAFLTIGELAQELGVAQHILRYWETRFAQLRPLQRAGNRRYYRPQDVAVARRIHQLLNVEGFTVKGAVKAMSERGGRDEAAPRAAPPQRAQVPLLSAEKLIDQLRDIRKALAEAIGENGVSAD